MAYFPLQYDYNSYFSDCIKSPERALIRKAIKNEYSCKEINYDDYLNDIKKINESKESRQGEKMSLDYTKNLHSRQNIVKSIGKRFIHLAAFQKKTH